MLDFKIRKSDRMLDHDLYVIRGAGETVFKLRREGSSFEVFDPGGRRLGTAAPGGIDLCTSCPVHTGMSRNARIRKEGGSLHPEWVVEGCSWRVKKNYMGADYAIVTPANCTVARLVKGYSAMSMYSLSVDSSSNVLLAVLIFASVVLL